MYAFDVHCNSYFPLFIALYGPPMRRAPPVAAPRPSMLLLTRLCSRPVLP